MLSVQPLIISGVLILAYVLMCAWYLWPRTVQAAKVLIAYASVGGNAAALAQHTQASTQGSVLTLNQLNTELLQTTETLLVVASTYGEGEAPENGRLFLSLCHALPENALRHVQYAVLALGDKEYEQYCAFGLQVAQALQSKGARPLFAPVTVDKLAEESLQQWQQQLLKADIGVEVWNRPLPTVECTQSELVLQKRTCVNSGSPGHPMYALEFSHSHLPSWTAGDIATLHVQQQKREYTIASVPQENVLRLLVRLQPQGLGSEFLTQQLNVGETAPFSIRQNPSFHPIERNVPMIFIGNGTGLSGLRAQLKQRERVQHHQNWLIFGERCPQADRPWREELAAWQACGHLTHVDFAFSRAEFSHYGDYHQGYVQQVLKTRAERLQAWIKQGAMIYLCGSKQGMASDVEQRLHEILGADTLQQLIVQERLKRDVY